MNEDREAFIQRMIDERDVSRTMAAHMWDIQPPNKQPRLVECDACPTSGGCVEVCMKAPAQPARQVGGDEREQFEACAEKYGFVFSTLPVTGEYMDCATFDAFEMWKEARAALAPAAVVMPEPVAWGRWAEGLPIGNRLMRYDGNPHVTCDRNEYHTVPLVLAEDVSRLNRHSIPASAVVLPERCIGNAPSAAVWNSALDEVERLNRRAIPLELLERVCGIAEIEGQPEGDELRALLGKDGE